MKHKAYVLAAFLILLTAGLIAYRVIALQYPLLPNPQVKAWQLGVAIHVKPEQAAVPVKVQISLPQNSIGQSVIDERINSGPLDAALLSERGNHRVIWSGMIDAEEDALSYEATLVIGRKPALTGKNPSDSPIPEEIRGEERILVQRLADRYGNLKPSARLEAITGFLKGTWAVKPPTREEQTAWLAFTEKHGRMTAIIALLRAAGLPARPVEGLPLREGSFSATWRWIDVWMNNAWERVDPESGRRHLPSEQLLPLVTGEGPLMHSDHAEITEIHWTLSRQIISPWRMHLEPVIHGGHFLNRWSLFSLPPEFQTIFRIILLVPIGALMICFLRNVIGLPSFGIFMPVLMALAFRTTGLLYGLLIFAGIVFIGYAIRRWINDLRLLLVPRLATILTIMIFFFAVLAIIGSQVGLRNMMAVGLLPFVILTMTVEKFYILIEESGVREAMVTSAGSAAVAVLTYGILGIERLQLLFFVFPELLFAVAACQILLGRYTGYRLSEYIRFRSLGASR